MPEAIRQRSLNRETAKITQGVAFEVALFSPFSPTMGEKVADRPDEGAFNQFCVIKIDALLCDPFEFYSNVLPQE